MDNTVIVTNHKGRLSKETIERMRVEADSARTQAKNGQWIVQGTSYEVAALHRLEKLIWLKELPSKKQYSLFFEYLSVWCQYFNMYIYMESRVRSSSCARCQEHTLTPEKGFASLPSPLTLLNVTQTWPSASF